MKTKFFCALFLTLFFSASMAAAAPICSNIFTPQALVITPYRSLSPLFSETLLRLSFEEAPMNPIVNTAIRGHVRENPSFASSFKTDDSGYFIVASAHFIAREQGKSPNADIEAFDVLVQVGGQELRLPFQKIQATPHGRKAEFSLEVTTRAQRGRLVVDVEQREAGPSLWATTNFNLKFE